MGLETGTYINDLNPANPLGTDPKSQGDDQIRLLKTTVKNSFPFSTMGSGLMKANGANAAVTVASAADIVGYIGSTAVTNATNATTAVEATQAPVSSTSGTLVAADAGNTVVVTAGITVPNSVFAAGDIVSIYNNSASSVTITASVTTLRQAGTTNTGNRTLAAYGMATVWFRTATEAIIAGSGVS